MVGCITTTSANLQADDWADLRKDGFQLADKGKRSIGDNVNESE